ncbi:transcription factor S-II, central domain-containing protein [Elsinoe ampelina]|uniref:Transcription factor BYE1 n=1 Tax=Elsinoe ampelina TaxID=302913 RepID=A0A6A6GPJ9_9PEZI|nr:transcription factor S-II, central domain-containing protein [Elsinoe ampelina]
MAGDEPRRSGRASKGHNKHLDDPVDSTPKPKKGAKGKSTKKASEPVEEEASEEVIRCVCGDNTDDEGGRAFIACDACEVWQHNVCMGVSLNEDEQPDHYFCEQCRPEEHKELLDGIAKGEKPWEDRIKAAEEAEKAKKKGKKGGRKSTGKATKTSEPPKPETPREEPPKAPTPVPAPAQDASAGTKRKFKEESQAPAPSNGQSTPKAPAAERPEKKRKSSTKEVSAAPASEDVNSALVDFSMLPKDRQNVGIVLEKLVKDGLDAKLKAGTYTLPEGQNANFLSHRLAQLIEYELLMNHGPPSKGSGYGAQFRSINANFKKNPALLDRLLKKTLTPSELATMSSQDMASEELQRERERMKEEADKQAVMIREDDKPRVRRTHKGDEYVDDSVNNDVGSVFTSKPVRRRESEIDVEGAGSPTLPTGTAGSPVANGRPRPIDTPAPIDQRRQSSQNFDINNVWAKTAASPDLERASSFQAPPPNGASATQPLSQNKVSGDADIDRMLADDNDDYSPADAKPADGEVIWRGKFTQSGVNALTVSARHAAGNDFSRFIPWQTFLPSQLEIEGRLEKGKADDYLCGLQWSKKSDVSVLTLSPYDDRKAFDEIFEYFSKRNKYAVGKKGHGCSELIKDLYISPVEANQAPPPHIDLLDYCSLKFPLPERVLLATFVVNKPASWDQADAMPLPPETNFPSSRMSLPGPAASPINPSGPGFSPAPRQGFTPETSAFPPNPYNSAPTAQQGYGQPTPPPAQPTMLVPNDPAAQQILGHYVNCPVAQQILTATSGRVQETEARNMRDIFEAEPAARERMDIFASVVGAKPEGLGG